MLSASELVGIEKLTDRFNPFQGIQVLSAGERMSNSVLIKIVSIPFREFKCCREYAWTPVLAEAKQFQSLSGNSSVVGRLHPLTWGWGIPVSIPFREFKCCRG